MNYLAHFHLAGDDPQYLTGALLGDYIKGPLKGALPEGIEQGVVLHRRIDQFTDEALQQAALYQHFPDSMRRYLGIVCDLYFDHLLAQEWAQHDARDLAQYNRDVVDALQTHASFLPDKARMFVARMEEHQLLTLYRQQHTMQQIYERTGLRLRRENPVSAAWPLMQEKHAELSDYFQTFYPALLQFAKDTRDALRQE